MRLRGLKALVCKADPLRLVEQILYLRRAALQQVESSHFPWSSLARPQERNADTTQQCSGDTQQVAGDDSASSPC